MRTSVDDSTASKCVTGIYTSNYNVTFYDMDYNNVPYTTEYAVKLTNQSMIGPTGPIQTSPSFISLATHTTVSPSSLSSSPLPTIPCTNCSNSKSLCYYHYCLNFVLKQTVLQY